MATTASVGGVKSNQRRSSHRRKEFGRGESTTIPLSPVFGPASGDPGVQAPGPDGSFSLQSMSLPF